ncbi:hypothetical protein O6H91_24G002700 [Diphasiastrum complanatum]|uniref:Uncharacterized protein n=1 Tax=Diphasiastrum complanatum TaxID=34168 RepID=A0ACC2A7F6_DIPCM|nr:hypothetical protein O6H91_24G002700 [Diphasiastrum complanatum]
MGVIRIDVVSSTCFASDESLLPISSGLKSAAHVFVFSTCFSKQDILLEISSEEGTCSASRCLRYTFSCSSCSTRSLTPTRSRANLPFAISKKCSCFLMPRISFRMKPIS